MAVPRQRFKHRWKLRYWTYPPVSESCTYELELEFIHDEELTGERAIANEHPSSTPSTD